MLPILLFSSCWHAMLLVLPRAVWELNSRNFPHSLALNTAGFKQNYYSVALTLCSQSRAVEQRFGAKSG